MKSLFPGLVLAGSVAIAAAATLPVMLGGMAVMCCLLGRDGLDRLGARRTLDERYARGEIEREEYLQRRRDLGGERHSV
jgi:hypothetical protein